MSKKKVKPYCEWTVQDKADWLNLAGVECVIDENNGNATFFGGLLKESLVYDCNGEEDLDRAILEVFEYTISGGKCK